MATSLCACSGLPFLSDDTNASDTLRWLVEPAGEPVWSEDVDTFSSGAMIIEDHVVSLVSRVSAEGGGLALRAWHAETGELAWEHAASTGDVGPQRTWPITIIEGPEGSPLIANLAPPVPVAVEAGMEEVEGFGFTTTSRDVQMHQVQFIDVRTGTIVAETERHGMYVWNTCGFVSAICARTLNLDKWRNGESEPYDEKLIRSTGEIVPLFPEEYLSGFSTSAQVFVVDRVDGQSALIRYDGNEVKWELDLDEAGLGSTPTAQLAFSAYRTADDDRSLLLVNLVDKGQSGGDVSEFSSSPVVLMIDWSTGELLWSEESLSLSISGLFESGDTQYIRGTSGSFEQQRPAANLLESRDLLTGALQWEIETTGLQSSLDDVIYSLSVPGEEYGMFFGDDGYQMIDLTTGETQEMSDDQIFPCSSRGPGVKLPQGSNPNLPLVEYTSNYFWAGCLSDRTRITDPAELSKMAVAGSSSRWLAQSEAPADPNTLYEEQMRVISNETGVHLYRF